MTHEARLATVLSAAAAEAAVVGLAYITRNAVAERAGLPAGSLRLYGSMADIKRKVAAMSPDCTTGDLDRYEAGRADRTERILSAALALAAAGNYRALRRVTIADAVGMPPSLVSYYLGDMDTLRDAVMRGAVERCVLAVVAQGLAVRDPIALAAPDELKTAALATLSG